MISRATLCPVSGNFVRGADSPLMFSAEFWQYGLTDWQQFYEYLSTVISAKLFSSTTNTRLCKKELFTFQIAIHILILGHMSSFDPVSPITGP